LLQLIALITNLLYFQQVSFVLRPIAESHIGFWVLVIPAAGGLIIGLMAKYGTPKIKGHGIPEAMEAVLTSKSKIEPKVAILKPISAAIAIGTGGPFGAEGPIIQTGGAVGSIFGQIIRTTPAERKVLLACGAGAGMAATFSTPIAGVILAIELLLFEFKSRSFIPLVIASTLATSMHFLLLGRGPLFEVGATDFGVPGNLAWYLVLGVLCGFAAVAFTRMLYWFEDRFEALPVPKLWLPAIGGLLLGVVGLFVPRVLGVGYGIITDILNGNYAVGLLLVILVFKSLALLVSLGSGTSGGLLAPMFMSSAAMGGAFAILVNQLVPGASLSPGAFALTAMGAVFGASSRATFTFIIFAFEITRDYNAILPLMLVGVIADGVALYFLKNTIMTEKLARRGLKVQTDYEADVMQRVKVSEVMDSQPPTVPASMPINELADRIAHHDPVLTRHQGLLIVDEAGQLAGVITRSDMLRNIEANPEKEQTVLEAGSDEVVVTYPDESLHEASLKMLQNNIGRLAVVERGHPKKLLGYLGRSGVIAARRQAIDEEQVQEAGWLSREATKHALGKLRRED
ncbi:MAG TPA: chloride channel protein, partial [Trueperaceae bacterium]